MAQSFARRCLAAAATAMTVGWMGLGITAGIEYNNSEDEHKKQVTITNHASWNNYLWDVVAGKRDTDGSAVGSLGLYLRQYNDDPKLIGQISSLSENIKDLRQAKTPENAFPDVYDYVGYDVFKRKSHFLSDEKMSGGSFNEDFIQNFVTYENRGTDGVYESTALPPRQRYWPEAWLNGWSWIPISGGFALFGLSFPIAAGIKQRRHRRDQDPLVLESEARLARLLEMKQNNEVRSAVARERKLLLQLRASGQFTPALSDDQVALRRILIEQDELTANIDAQTKFLESLPNI